MAPEPSPGEPTAPGHPTPGCSLAAEVCDQSRRLEGLDAWVPFLALPQLMDKPRQLQHPKALPTPHSISSARRKPSQHTPPRRLVAARPCTASSTRLALNGETPSPVTQFPPCKVRLPGLGG